MKITEKVDGITLVPQNRLCLTPPCPKAVKMELTAKCNFKCKFCATADKLRPQGEMDKEFFKRITKEMREAGVEEIGHFFLGESFLCKWLPWSIEWVKKECGFPYSFITTNGGPHTTPERMKECMQAGLDSMKFSLNFADEKQFAEITRMPPKVFAMVVQHIKDAYNIRKENGYKCGLYTSSIRYNDEQVEKMEPLLAELEPYVDEHYWLPLYSQANLTGKTMEKMGGKPVKGNFGRWGVDESKQVNACFALFSEARITYDAKLSGCCFNHTHEFDCGDLNNMTFMECWHSQKYINLRKAMLAGDMTGTACEDCWEYTVQ